MHDEPRAAALLRLLAAFVADDDEEAGYASAIADMVHRASDPFARDAYAPGHVTASAFVLDRDRTTLLLIHHAKLDRWLQPGGHVDPLDESVLDAARREVREETGVADLVLAHHGIFDVDVHAIPARPTKNEPEHRHFDVRFLFVTDTERPRAGTDARAARFVALGDVATLESDRSVMRAVAKILTRRSA